jgi:hypothetical protein
MQLSQLVKRHQLHRHVGRPAPDVLGVAPVAGVGLGHRAGWEPLGVGRPPAAEGGVAAGTDPPGQLLDLGNRRAWRCQWPVYNAPPMTTAS